MQGVYELHLPNACFANMLSSSGLGVAPQVSTLSTPPQDWPTPNPDGTYIGWYNDNDPPAVSSDPDAINTKGVSGPVMPTTYGTSDEVVIEIAVPGANPVILTYSLVAAGDFSPDGIIITSLPNAMSGTVGGLPLSTGVGF